jgi:predicted RND superfamily exporter protein
MDAERPDSGQLRSPRRRRRLTEWYVDFLLRWRTAVILVVALATAFFTYQMRNLVIYTNFFDLYPPRHPYIQLYQEYRKMFGGANVLVIAVSVKEGDIYTIPALQKIDRITRALMDMPGVDPFQVISLTHPKLKNIEVSNWGISIRPIIFPAFPRNQDDLDRIRHAVYTNQGIRGFYVSPDDKAATIFAGFWEEGTDLNMLFNRVQELKKQEEDANTTVYVTGYPMLYAWILHYYPMILKVIGITALAIVALLWFYFRTVQGVVIPIFSGVLSTIWALGFAALFKFNIDPLVLVVLVLITARALSHSVQSMERYHEEYYRLGDKYAAIRVSYLGLFAPAFVSIAADGFAILTLAVAPIPLIQNLAFVCSFFIITITISVITLHPIILTFVRPPRHDPMQGHRFSDRVYNGINGALVRLSQGRARWALVVIFFVTLAGGLYYSHQLRVGDVSIGKAILHNNHPYNIAYDFVNKHFVGTSQLVIIAEGDKENAIQDGHVLAKIEEFQKYMERGPDTGGSLSITSMIRRLYRMYHEAEPRWEFVPDNARDLGNLFFMLQGGTAPGEMDRFFSRDYRNATITVFYRDYSNEVIKNAIERAKTFIANNPVEHIKFRLAGGLMGVLAAVNEEVEWSYRVNIALVMITVFILSFLTYRSVLGALIVMMPSIVAQPLSEAFMYWWGIDANINSLPVAAVGIGIGIDYGYYVLSRIVEEYKKTPDFDTANAEALMTTGKAIMFTGTTLTAAVIFWLFFPMKFQAEMALLLTLLLFFHIVGALVFIPAFVSLLKPRFLIRRGTVTESEEAAAPVAGYAG